MLAIFQSYISNSFKYQIERLNAEIAQLEAKNAGDKLKMT